jgi:hypothetical protein
MAIKYQQFPFKGLPKFSKIGIFRFANIPFGNPAQESIFQKERSELSDCLPMKSNWFAIDFFLLLSRVDRFFLLQHTKTGIKIPSNPENVPNGHTIYQMA